MVENQECEMCGCTRFEQLNRDIWICYECGESLDGEGEVVVPEPTIPAEPYEEGFEVEEL